MSTTVTALGNGQRATVVALEGGRSMTARLDAMGIRVGVVIAKVSGIALRGPVVLKVGRSNVAVGHGVAERILVDAL